MASRPNWQHWNMPVTSFPEYANALTGTILALVATGQTRILDLRVEQRSTLRGFLAGIIAFEDESELHFREFIDATQAESRLMYAYHYHIKTLRQGCSFDMTMRGIARLCRNASISTRQRALR